MVVGGPTVETSAWVLHLTLSYWKVLSRGIPWPDFHFQRLALPGVCEGDLEARTELEAHWGL